MVSGASGLSIGSSGELLEDGQVDRLFWFDTEDMLPDGLTKGSVDREPLLKVAAEGEWAIKYVAPVWKKP